MNTRAKAILAAAALATATTALNSQAADQGDYFEQHRDANGYMQYDVAPTPTRTKPQTAYQKAENDWLTAERTQGGGSPPIPFPVPAAPAPKAVKPATPYQTAESTWLAAELTRGGGSPPIPFPVPAPATKSAVKPATPSQAAENDWITNERNRTDEAAGS